LIVAKDEIVINTNKATVSSFKKKQTTVAIKKEALDYYVKKETLCIAYHKNIRE
jgi:membrane-bound lytic murein transglycosylase D